MHSSNDSVHSGGKLTIPVPARRRKSAGDLPAATNVDVDTVPSPTLRRELCTVSTGDPPPVTQDHDSCNASISNAAPATRRRRSTSAACTATGIAVVAAAPRKQYTNTDLVPIRGNSTTTARRKRSSGGPQPSFNGVAKRPCCNELATHEIVGWLLGAFIAMRETAEVESVPVLLSSKRGQELDLLRAELTQQLAVKVQPPCSRVQLLAQLLRELHAYCGGEGPSPY